MEEQVTPEQVKPEETTTQPPIDNKPDELSQFITSATSELMAARPQSLDTFREVVGNPITGSNPLTKANPFTTSGFAENLDYSALKKLEENSNDYNKMRPYTYSGDYDAANFERYSSTDAYKHLGFTPYRDNEALYNDKMTFGDTFSRSYSSFTKLVATGFAGGITTWGDMFTDPLAADEKSARDMKRTVAIGSSTKGGLGGFVANTAIQLGYTVGVAYELALEMYALSAITGFTGGLTGAVTVPTMAARLGLGARRLLGIADITVEAAKNITKGEAVLNAAKAAEQGSESLKNIKNLKNVNDIRSFWNTLPGKVIKKTGEVINPFDDTIKALSKTDYASDLARNLGVFGGFAEDVIQIKTAASEAKLEGGMSKIDITKDLIDEYRRTHNGEDPTGEDLQRIENLADAEARRVTLWNLPAIMTSNKFLHATMLAPINKMMGKVSKSADDLIFTDKTFKVVGDDLISKAKVRAKSLVKPATYGRYSMNYLKANLAEGIQENIQEALAIGASEHAMATYTDPAKAAYEGYMGSFMSGVKQQLSAQGAETFAGGFVMGMFAQPIIGAPTWTMSKLSDLTINREKAKKFKEEKKAQNERDAATLNELYQNDVNILAPDLKNIITQQGLAKDLYTAVQNSNEKEARDAKYSALHNQISTALRTGKYDIFLDKWKDYKNMSATEIEDAFAQYGVEKGEGQKVLDNIDNIVSRSEKIRNTYENVANEFPNPYNYQNFEKDTPLYKANKNAFIAWEEAKQNLVFAKDSFDNYKERIQSMAKTFSAYAEEIGQTDAQTMMRLLSSKDTLTEVSTLEEEIKVLDDGIPAQASLKKQKQKILDTLLEFETRIEQTQDPSLSEEQKMWAKNKAKETFDRYVKAVSNRNKSILFDDTINKAYSLIFDSRTSNTDMEGLARSINVLSNPKGFLNVQKRIAQAFELLKERAPDIVKNNQKIFDDIVLRNKLHNSLGEMGLKFEDEFLEKYDEALKNNTEIPSPAVFINPATGEEIKDGPKFEEAMNLWNTYLDITKKDEEEATKEAETKKAAEGVTKSKEFDENDINTFPEQLVDFLKTEFKEAEDLNTTDGRTFNEWLKDDAQIGIIRYFMKEFKGELKEEPVVEKVEEEGKTKEENIEKIISSAKTPQEASLKIWGLGYGFSTEEQERLNNYIKDRFDGKTSQTYAEFSKTEAPTTTATDTEATQQPAATTTDIEAKEEPATPEEVIIPEKAAAVIQPIETAPQAPTMTEGDFTVRKLKLQNEIKDLRTEFKAIDKDIEKLEKEKDVLDKALKEYSKRSDEVKEIITENITEDEVAAIAEQENIPVEQVQEAIVDALFEPKPSKFKEALRNVINKLKKIILGLFLTGTLVTSASAFSFNNDGQVTFSLENAVENLLPEQQEQWAKRYLDKKGLITIADAQIVPEKTQPVVVENPKPEKIFQIIGTVPDSYNPSDSLLSYRSQWDNEDGFKYVPMPVKQDLPKGGMKVNGVLGVGHFLLDASVAEGAVYSFEYNKAFLDKAKKNDHWIPAFKRLEDGNVLLKYKKPADIDKEDIVVSPLRQFKFSDIAFDKTQTPKGFQKGIKEVKTKQGEGTYIIFKDRSGYSRFSGGSVVFIFKDKYDNTIVRDFAGSINQIENEGIMIQSNYNLEPGELTIGYHDVGSFSAKPKAKAGEISSKQWQGFNPGGMTGGALLIPIEGNIKQLPSKPMEKGAASNLIGLLGLAAMIRKKNKASKDLTDSDLEKIKKGLDKINDKIAELRLRSDELKTRYHARIEDKNTLEEDYAAIKARDKSEAPVVYSKKKPIGFEIPIAGNKTAVFNQTDKYFEFLDGKGELITDASRIETAAKKLSENNSYIRLWWMNLLDQPKRDEVLDDITKYYSMLNSIGPETKGKISNEDTVIYMIMERLAGVKINPVDAKDLTDINRRVWVAPRGTKGKDLDTFVTDELMAEGVPGTYDGLMETVKGIIMTYQDGIKNKDFKEFLRRADPQADIIDFQKSFINKYGLDVDRVSDELERSELLDYKGEPGDTRDIYQPKIEKINKDAFNRLGIKDKFNTLAKELAKEGQIYGTLTDDYPRQLVAGDDEIFQIKLDDGRTVRTTPGKYFPTSFPIPVNKRVLITREIKPINGQQRTVLSVTYNGLDFAYVLENEPKQFRDTSAPDLSVEDLNEQIDDKALSAAKERNYTVSYENINNPEQSGQYFVENVGKDSVSLKSLITKEEVKVPTENIPESIKSINDTEKPVSTTDDVTKVEKNQTITDGVIKDIDNSKSLDEAADDFFENIC